MVAFLQRYQGAAYRYLLGAVRNPENADELFQEFALRLVQGAFRGADPRRGRFRDYLKTALYHLVVDFQKRQRRLHRRLEADPAEPAASVMDVAESDEQFVRNWRDDLLGKAWIALEEMERCGGPSYFSVLKFRTGHPEVSSTEFAARLTEQLRPQRPFTETGIRKTLERARARFAELLLEEVIRSLNDPSCDQLEQELIDVGLLPYCRSALERHRKTESRR